MRWLSVFLVVGVSLDVACSGSSTTGIPGRQPADGGPASTTPSDSGDDQVAPSGDDALAASGDDAGLPRELAHCEPTSSDCTCVTTTNTADMTPQCPPATMPNPVCCAETGWPTTPITTCQCTNWACSESPSLCICTLDSTGTATGSSCSSSHPYCCESLLSDGTVNQCQCGSFPCQNGDVPVSACSVSVIGCVAIQHRVASCK
jgi:hypothetical protein